MNIKMAKILLILMKLFLINGENEDYDRTADLDNAKCDSVICGSIVSKCLLTNECKCDNIHLNKTCANNCSICLDYLYQDCCLCFDLCDKEKYDNADYGSRSNVGHIKDPQPDFFALITEIPDRLERWQTITYSLILPFEDTSPSVALNQMEEMKLHCTVAYIAQCISFQKCRTFCSSMGSTTYRWFHDGCCECVGQHCNEFGINRSNCTSCPVISSEQSLELHEDL